MDGSLKQYLDGLDWEALIVRLTREAGKIMAGYRWSGRTPEETRQMAGDFALDTMGQAYDGCMKCLQGRFDPGRLEPGAEVDGASDDVAKLISACVAQLECNPEQQRVNWTQIEKELGWTRYKREQMRPLLEEQLQRVVEKSSEAN